MYTKYKLREVCFIMNFFREAKAKKLYKNNSIWALEEFEKMLDSSKISFDNENIQNYYIQMKISSFQKFYKERGVSPFTIFIDLTNRSIPIERILEEHGFIEEIIHFFAEHMNHSIPTRDIDIPDHLIHFVRVLNEIIKVPKFKEKLIQSSDFQTYGELFLQRNFILLDDNQLLIYKECISFFLKMGYVPFKNKSELIELIEASKTVAKQDYYNTLSLIDENITNKIYHLKFNYLKDYYLNTKSRTDVFEISKSLPFSVEDSFVTYWKNLSDLLETDSMEFVFQKVNSACSESGKIFQDFFEQQFTQDIPNSSFVNDLFAKKYIPKLLKYNSIEEPIYKFLMYNIDEVKGCNKGFIIMLKKLENIQDEIIKQHFFGEVNSYSDIENYFCENGFAPSFYEKIKFSRYNDFLPYLEPDWKKNYTPSNAQYMKFSFKFPGVLWQSIFQETDKYFDANGPTKEFYDYFSWHYDRKIYKILPELDSNWQSHYSEYEVRFINFVNNNPEYANDIINYGKYSWVLFGKEIEDDYIIDLLNHFKDCKLFEIFLKFLNCNGILIKDDFSQEIIHLIDSKPNIEKTILTLFEVSLSKDKVYLFFEKLDGQETFLLDCCQTLTLTEDKKSFIKMIFKKGESIFETKECLLFIQYAHKQPEYRLFLSYLALLDQLKFFFDSFSEEERISLLNSCSHLKNTCLIHFIIKMIYEEKEILKDSAFLKFQTFIQNNPKYEDVLSEIIDKENYEKDFLELFESNSEENIAFCLDKLLNISNSELQFFILKKLIQKGVFSKEYVLSIYKLYLLIHFSNANEILACENSILDIIIKQENPVKTFSQIESIFLKNNLPYIGKVFSVFKLLHSDYDFNFSESSKISPMLKRIPSNLKNTNIWGENVWRDIIIFSDLVKSALGSNNKSIKDYIENLEKGNELFLNLSLGNIALEKLNINELELLHIYTNHLNTLYNNTLQGKKENNILTGDRTKDIEKLIQIFSSNGKLSYDLPDRIIKMYFHFAGFNTLNEVKTYMNEKIKTAEQRNRKFAEQKLTIEVGDFIKGIGKIDYLHNILQNGSLAVEFLGASASYDSTPLDTDLSRILELKERTIEMINKTSSSDYGPIFFLLKNDERFLITRENQNEEKNCNLFDPSKIEIFRTLKDNHYGIRTGFASSEINAIIMSEYDKRVGLEIAMNGFYIPVFNFEKKIVFTPEDYDNLRSKMRGLSYYGENNYVFSEEIALIKVDSILEEQEREKPTIESYRSTIYKEVAKALQKYGLTLKNSISNDLSNGTVELIDTGSTSRSTFVPEDIDFDFVMRLDREILLNDEKLINLKNDLLQAFYQKDSKDVIDGNFRLKKAYVDGIPNSLKIDITFLQKTDKVDYSTDLVIQDYLNTIKKQDEGKYKQIIGNIVIAKKVFKEAGCYKTRRSDSTQGGLGGVGIETFILQNGGSFITAAKNFLEVANGKNFKEFKKEYCIWDFGNNFLAESRGSYPHDNFVADNMNELGYEKMKEALKNYLFSLSKEENLEEISLGR